MRGDRFTDHRGKLHMTILDVSEGVAICRIDGEVGEFRLPLMALLDGKFGWRKTK